MNCVRRYLPLALLLLMAAASCKRVPSGVLSREKMSALIADVYRGESVVEFNGHIYAGDSMKKVVKQSIFAAHGVTQEQFDSSLSWYGRHIEEYIKVCDDAIALLENQLEMIPPDAVAGSIQVAGDSAMVWMLPTYYRITSKYPSQFISFQFDRDDEWKRGDSYDLGIKVGSLQTPIGTSMAVDYEDGVTEFLTTSTMQPGWHRMSLRLDSTRTASRVYGYIEVQPLPGEVVYLDSVTLMRTRVSPSNYFRRNNQHTIVLTPDSTAND